MDDKSIRYTFSHPLDITLREYWIIKKEIKEGRRVSVFVINSASEDKWN